ncbi:MAG: indolepyruvate ferredoxin oxidoreductase subunit alpha [Deltaproteobacteria bacterium]|nr:indolepyruvate ferredoxin oxidoreductase subunit alpha [Deltaproteobacteria bacterium]MBW2596434.1 indolepyruvate ferredoxin oxidoreductase subunit alpha [Deltaproteobacteria bacterium]MBW2649556.1 indolepyruvate ferredoxin oxidoreductase subunit alpha [Deltaproteobacteria bacterium]
MEQKILMGNEAIGRGLVESGCSLASSYPGTPASEILESVVTFAGETETPMHIEWSINEKVAYEVALGHSYTGKRSAVAMKQVGLNVASDPFMRSAYLGVTGGLVVVVADDPGPHSSQTEQDSRFFAQFARVPVFDPSNPAEAKDMVGRAFELSEKYEVPVMLRPTTRVCHARQNVSCLPPEVLSRKAHFEKNPGRWVATPKFLTDLHRQLNDKIDEIAGLEELYPPCVKGDGSMGAYCIISSGVAYANTCELLEGLGFLGKVDLFKVDVPYPLNRDFIKRVNADYEKILVIEETYPTIEMQLTNPAITGRISKDVPDYGELTPEVIEKILEAFLNVSGGAEDNLKEAPGTRPTLCPGCPHRAAFYAIRKTFPKGIFPSDIGCYTLGMNLGAVDTCHCMGAGISQGAGLYHAYAADSSEYPTIVATIGDSTFFHAGIPGLINAVFTGARFIIVILDNSTTAMTGNQPTPQVGIMADGSAGNTVYIPDLVKASGVRFLRECDPYDLETFISHLKEADRFCRGDEGGVAVIISKHPCVMDREALKKQTRYRVTVTEECTGCKVCIKQFECPSLIFDEESEKVFVDQNSCIGCGVCDVVCPVGAIVVEEAGGEK